MTAKRPELLSEAITKADALKALDDLEKMIVAEAKAAAPGTAAGHWLWADKHDKRLRTVATIRALVEAAPKTELAPAEYEPTPEETREALARVKR